MKTGSRQTNDYSQANRLIISAKPMVSRFAIYPFRTCLRPPS